MPGVPPQERRQGVRTGPPCKSPGQNTAFDCPGSCARDYASDWSLVAAGARIIPGTGQRLLATASLSPAHRRPRSCSCDGAASSPRFPFPSRVRGADPAQPCQCMPKGSLPSDSCRKTVLKLDSHQRYPSRWTPKAQAGQLVEAALLAQDIRVTNFPNSHLRITTL